jgi:Uncharacterized ACR, COG1993
MLLRIFIGENDRSPESRPLYETIVLKARDVHLAGATVLRGPMGFGHASLLHTTKILRRGNARVLADIFLAPHLRQAITPGDRHRRLWSKGGRLRWCLTETGVRSTAAVNRAMSCGRSPSPPIQIVSCLSRG